MPGFAINNTPTDTGSIDHKAEFHRAHRWRIENLGAPNIGIGIFEGNLYAHTLELPSLTFEDEKVAGADLKYKFPVSLLQHLG